MKTIRLKIKYLLLILAFGLSLTFFGETIFWNSIAFYNSNVSIENQINLDKIKSTTIQNENRRLTLLLTDSSYNLYDLVTISDGAMTSASHLRKESSDKIYERFIHFDKNNDILTDHPDYYINVILTQWFSGNTDRTLSMLNAINPSNLEDDIRNQFHMIKLGVALTYYNVDDALTEIAAIDSEIYIPAKNAIRSFIGIYLDPSISYEIPSQLNISNEDRFVGYFSTVYDIVDIRQPSDSPPRSTKGLSVKGQVTLNGKPYSGLFLFEDLNRSMHSHEGFDDRLFIPDENGYYNISDVNPSAHNLGIIIPWQIIHDKQFVNNFRLNTDQPSQTINIAIDDGIVFDKLKIIDNQLYYSIYDVNASTDRSYGLTISYVDPDYESGGSFSSMEISADALQGIIDLTDLRNRIEPFYARVSGPVTYERLMEPLYLTGEYYFSLRPSDGQSGEYITNGLFSDALSNALIVAGEHEPSTGDLFIKEGNLDAAIKWYEENLSIHSMKVLIALYKRGYIENSDDEFLPWELEGVDKNKAAYYTRMLIDAGVSDYQTLSSLAYLYKDLKQYNDEYAILGQMIALNSSKYVHISLGMNMINRGDFDNGLDYLLPYCNPDIDDDRYLHYIFVSNRQDLLPDSYAELFEAIDTRNYQPMFIMVRDGQYDKAWNYLMATEDSDLKFFYELLLLESFQTDTINYEKQMLNLNPTANISNGDHIDYYVSKTKSLNNISLRSILKMIKNENNWFMGNR